MPIITSKVSVGQRKRPHEESVCVNDQYLEGALAAIYGHLDGMESTIISMQRLINELNSSMSDMLGVRQQNTQSTLHMTTLAGATAGAPQQRRPLPFQAPISGPPGCTAAADQSHIALIPYTPRVVNQV